MIDVAKLLKDAPKGMKLYSPLLGEVKFDCVKGFDECIIVTRGGKEHRFTKSGKYIIDITISAECLLFPSKDCRTWEGWKLPVEPKFKVGDKVIYNGKQHTVTFVNDKYYGFSGGVAGCLIELQDQWHLAPKPHYDIANFYAGMPVLVRDSDKPNERWQYVHFSHYYGKSFYACGCTWDECIPFNEKTKHLLGTTDMPDERFINW